MGENHHTSQLVVKGPKQAMWNYSILLFLGCLSIFEAQAQKSSLLWREDGRCGDKYPVPTGTPGQCDPAGDGPKKGPCCSPKGFCGNTVKHCECETCVDYRKFAEEKNVKLTKEVKNKATQSEQEEFAIDLTPKEDAGKRSPEIVETRSGSINGSKVTPEDGLTYYEFHGIPYAQPPVDKLRFKSPLPVRPWTNTLDASKKGPYCWQQLDFQPEGSVEMSEDCLHLSIYAEDLKPTQKPVMIWIHGGGFTQGSGNDYTPVKLIREDVIVVSINYRLGALGFLTFGNNIVSGNMGLKDQALAIQWVKQNIESFGGNPNRITIFGESAGGMSVHAQVLSPWNYGQIQGAIAQSGTIIYHNSIKTSGEREERFAKHAAENIFECPNYNDELDESVLECLQGIDGEYMHSKLSLTIDQYFDLNNPSPFVWQPVIDNYASNPFLPMDPLEAMKTGIFNRIPFISGTVRNEGALMVGIFRSQGTRENLIENWTSYGTPLILSASETSNFTAEEIRLANISLKYYNHPKGDTDIELDQPLMDLFTDVMFVSPDQKSVQLMSKYTTNVFNYHITQQTDNSLLAKVFNQTKEYTPAHGDDLISLMELYGLKLDQSDEDAALAEHMVKYWTNFAKFGHPTPSGQDLPFWDSVTQTENNYLELKAAPEMKQDLLPERMQFWERMLWAAKEEKIERKAMYIRATQYLLDNSSKKTLFQL